ncbi:unnamed protein product [Kuraishia capsulata CBS 1993]|uniref:Hsp70 nucleotide exchange factor FES1 n=1 Tax=Kuraishia capsulata CBS 1993 TaxID=1382522 RepID=W6ML90_9ASCO|nr:uncharacterized protein KUCA_T00001512001 [Kuraishia capsulata CBS 1993]CDK25542.1 unnamed protein product [Kuraishia capsulata CBS 1993]
MEKLLKWSIANQSEDNSVRAQAGAPDPELLSQLFGAPDEAALMVQNMQVIVNEEATLENREIAFDNFEMLIENLDNANNIENLKLWPALISQLDSSQEAIRKYACSCIGTALQNNTKSQEDFLKHDGGIKKLIDIAEHDSSEDVQLKALYALSNSIRHDDAAYAAFEKEQGWKLVSPLLAPSVKDKVKLRVLSLLSALISTGVSDEKKQQIRDGDVVNGIVVLVRADGHIGCVDKALNLLAQLVAAGYKFSESEVNSIDDSVKNVSSIRDQLSEEDFQTIKQVTLQ